jgi:hypothetical protein
MGVDRDYREYRDKLAIQLNKNMVTL